MRRDGTVIQQVTAGRSGGASAQSPDTSFDPVFTAKVEDVRSVNDTVVPAGSSRAARLTHFFAGDHLGTAQMEFSSGGYPVWQGQFGPYGDELNNLPTAANQQLTGNHYKFTGKERDTESGLDYFGARYYASSMGRWMSPDWADKPEAVPYASLPDPQSLNLYAYAGNNPLSRRDADGHLSAWREGGSDGPGIDFNDADHNRSTAITQRFWATWAQSNQAQQQYGRQADGSYKADPAKVQGAIDAGKPIHEPGNPNQRSECVFACKFLAQMRNIGTSQWRKGASVLGLNDTTDIGLAIATLGSGTYPSQHGNSGIYMRHDANGGIKIVDQWPNNGPEYNHPFEHTLTRHDQGVAMDPSAYFVIRVPNP